MNWHSSFMDRRCLRFLLSISVTVAASVVIFSGCAPTIHFEAKPVTPLKPVYCFDTVGHKPGSKPYILGGTCCCTPTRALMEQYHADGLLKDMDLGDLIRLYEERGIKTSLDHTGCNNLCKWGPHVVKGGKCMVPPTPGTANFEEIRYAAKYVPVDKKKKGK